jgi:hypothetical protein
MAMVKWTGWALVVAGIGVLIVGIVERGDNFVTVSSIFAIGGGLTLMGLAMVGATMAEAAARRRRASVLATGIWGTATIAALKPIAASADGMLRCKITVTVALPERPSYQARITELVGGAALPRYVEGAAFSCRVSQDDPRYVVLIDDRVLPDGSSLPADWPPGFG